MLLTIPEQVTTRFLVATDERLTPDTRYLRDALPANELGRTARDLLDTPRLSIHGGWSVPTGWSVRLNRLGGAAEELPHVLAATRHIVVTATAAPSSQPRHAQASRLVARALAAAVSGRLVDLASDQVLTQPPAPITEPDRFRLGDEWIGIFVSLDPHRRDRVVVGTSGLHRFGLPELTTRGVPHDHMLTAANLLRAVAYRLYTDHIEPLSTTKTTAPTPADHPPADDTPANASPHPHSELCPPPPHSRQPRHAQANYPADPPIAQYLSPLPGMTPAELAEATYQVRMPETKARPNRAPHPHRLTAERCRNQVAQPRHPSPTAVQSASPRRMPCRSPEQALASGVTPVEPAGASCQMRIPKEKARPDRVPGPHRLTTRPCRS